MFILALILILYLLVGAFFTGIQEEFELLFPIVDKGDYVLFTLFWPIWLLVILTNYTYERINIFYVAYKFGLIVASKLKGRK